jgi:hypothetical protein
MPSGPAQQPVVEWLATGFRFAMVGIAARFDKPANHRRCSSHRLLRLQWLLERRGLELFLNFFRKGDRPRQAEPRLEAIRHSNTLRFGSIDERVNNAASSISSVSLRRYQVRHLWRPLEMEPLHVLLHYAVCIGHALVLT